MVGGGSSTNCSVAVGSRAKTRSLGGFAPGSLAEFLKLSRIKEQVGTKRDSQFMVNDLLADHEAIIKTLRNDLEACVGEFSDVGTSDFLTGLMEKHEKMAWMLRATLDH